MPNYANGKVYKMMSLVDDYIYIGSTCCSLSQRKAQHRDDSARQTTRAVYAHFNQIGWDNCRIVLIENYACANKEELVKKELEYIQLNNNDKLLNAQKYMGSRCEHHKVRSQCNDCHGSSICEHNRFRTSCQDCGGQSICEHRRRRSDCKDCIGSSICQHNRLKYTCKACAGSDM